MKSIFQQRKRSSTAAAIVCMVLGLFMLLWPGGILGWICRIAGFLLLLGGIFYIGGYFLRPNKLSVFQADLLIGILLALLGLWMLLYPGQVIVLMQYIFGIFILVHGIMDLQAALNLRSFRYRRWTAGLILSLVTIALGLLILLHPFGTLSALVILIGLVLIFNGASELYLIFRLSQAMKS